jgi:hypothetical protein
MCLTVWYMLWVVSETGSVCDSWLHEVVGRQRPELCVTVGYMKLWVDRDLNRV